MKNIPGLSPELAEQLRKTDPALLDRVEAALNTAPPNSRVEKTLKTAEALQLSGLQKQMAGDVTPEARGELAVQCLVLRGLNDLFPRRSVVK